MLSGVTVALWKVSFSLPVWEKGVRGRVDNSANSIFGW